MNAVEYNREVIGRRWNLGDLPEAWPGHAVLAAADLDHDGSIDQDEYPAVEWVRFSEAVREFQALQALSPDGKLGTMTLSALMEVYPRERQGDALKKINGVEFFPAEVTTAEPSRKVKGGGARENRVAAVWNSYGAEIVRQSALAGIPTAAALAVFCVESGGRGYDPRTGLVLIRVEMRGRFRDRSREFQRRYGKGQAAEWKALEEWARYDQQEAFERTSWGLPQIMGFNARPAGYVSAEEMAAAFQRSVVSQVRGFFGFIDAMGLCRYVRDMDWPGFVRRYNGPGQVGHYTGVLKAFLETIEEMEVDGVVFRL